MFQDLHRPSCFNPLVPELNSDHIDSAVSAPLETCRPAVAQVHIGDDVPSVYLIYCRDFPGKIRGWVGGNICSDAFGFFVLFRL